MFINIGWGELIILMIASLLILGPQRLPKIVSCTCSTFRKLNNYISTVINEFRDELTLDLNYLKEPYNELNKLKNLVSYETILSNIFKISNCSTIKDKDLQEDSYTLLKKRTTINHKINSSSNAKVSMIKLHHDTMFDHDAT